MGKSTKQIGDAGEELAVRELISNGYKILTRNFRSRFGEIDIIAEDSRTLVFAEVKAKKDDFYGAPAEMITNSKLEKIKKTAANYILENEYSGDWRIDAVVIEKNKIEIIRNITL